MYFPIICVDNFFDNPQEVRDLAFSLDFSESDPRYPGKRTKQLHEVAPEYFDFFCKRLMGIFYDFREKDVSWEIYTTFQLIEKFGNNSLNKGWVHCDTPNIFAGVLYLNQNSNLESGTSIFKPKSIGAQPINVEQKNDFYKNNYGNEETVKALNENNEKFIETITFKNVYNRLIGFGGEHFHAVNSFVVDQEPRLTQVFFVRRVSANWYPMPNSRLIR